MRVRQQEGRRIDEHASILLRLDFEAPQRRLRECLLHCRAFVRVRADRPVAKIRLDQKNLGSDARKSNEVLWIRSTLEPAELSAIEADVVRPDTGREGVHIEEL